MYTHKSYSVTFIQINVMPVLPIGGEQSEKEVHITKHTEWKMKDMRSEEKPEY